ncbi:MAG: NADH-quinone oxidoreductase subunit L [Deltaproteobacteria bacterium]|nr:NADH-quinone oxidoreductase subunit L [Deltaproteobacteria bacterium]
MVNVVESDQLRWIVLLPLLAAAYHGVMLGIVRRPTPRWLIVGLSCGSVLTSFMLSCLAFWELIQLPAESNLLLDDVYTWIGSGLGAENLTAELALAFDPLAAVMCLVVTGVGSLIHVYSVGYMEGDQRDDCGFQRFFCYLNLFTFSMLVLVLGDSLVLMFVGWEGVGLCSYLLIGFWYMDSHNAYCGSKAFIVNRVGDLGFLVGLFVLFGALSEAGTPVVAFRDIAAEFGGIVDATVRLPFLGEARVVTVAALCFFFGAVGKSAQLPLHVWLPDAMAGPTPVSALIHAATMVTAGVYMVCRMSFLYAASPEASAVVAWTGALTALFGATLAIVQTDVKKVLAYSTVSQLGYMFLAAGCGGFSAALFHLGTHAFFKALLFLGAGSVILALHHEQDTEKMGGLRRLLPVTHWLFLVGVLAIGGVPPLAGFFSKDEILVAAYVSEVPGHAWLYRIGLVTAGLTAFYMWRLQCRMFYGRSRVEPGLRERVEEPDGWMSNPLWILASLAALAGFVGLPQAWGDVLTVSDSNSLANFVSPVLAAGGSHAVENGTEYGVALRSLAASLAGFGLAHFFYLRRPELPGKLRKALPSVHRLLVHKYYVDELYDAVLVRPLVALSERVLYRGVDAKLIDGLGVEGTARAVRALAAHGLKYAQTGFSQSYVFLMLLGALAVVGYLVR